MFDQIRMSKRFFPKSGKIAALRPTWIASVPQNNCGENATDLTKFRHESARGTAFRSGSRGLAHIAAFQPFIRFIAQS
ncbi:MAG: hypothetical protein WEB58_17455 [Planctomycetaceae bacterium]